jgi:hypothetical protein
MLSSMTSMSSVHDIAIRSLRLGPGKPLFAAFIGAAIEHKKTKSRPAAETQRVQALRVAPHANA